MRFFLLLLFVFVGRASSHVVRSNSAEWEMLNHHTVENVVAPDDIDLDNITKEAWSEIVSLCPKVPTSPRINVFFDYLLENTTTLAWASQNLHLSSRGYWVSTIYEAMNQNRNTSSGSTYDMTIAFNPNPPNGWYVEKDCSNISARFDLRTVLKHELLHGLIFAGSVREIEDSSVFSWTVGYTFGGKCYPRLYDTKIKYSDGSSIFQNLSNVSVSNCLLRADKGVRGADLYIGDVELYHPYSFRSGSSISHHNYPGNLMYASTTPMVCMDLGDYEGKVLAELGIGCTINNVTYEASSGRTKTMHSGLAVISIIILILLC
jgi:hypothetical protein